MPQKSFFYTIPTAKDEAKRIDGANSPKSFLQIYLLIQVDYRILRFNAIQPPKRDFILPKMLLIREDTYAVAVVLMNLGEVEFA